MPHYETETQLPLYLASTGDESKKVLSIFEGDDGIDLDVFGRAAIAAGGDMSEFDLAPYMEAQIDPTLDDSADVVLGETEPAPFESPAVDEHFPVYMTALRHFQAAEAKPRVARIDTEETYGDFVCERAVEELSRRLDDLRAVVEAHAADPLAHPHEHRDGRMIAAKRADILGAAEAVSDLRRAASIDDVTEAMNRVPLDLPGWARGKVKCWRDGDAIVCSIRFAAADGTPRIATMADKSAHGDADHAARQALRAGVHPAAVLGAIDDLAAVATGKRLVRDVAGAAMQAQRRLDVLGMSDVTIGAEPVILTSAGVERGAPLAALMHLHQLADAGDPQARVELVKMERAAKTPLGRRVAAPMLSEARQRLEAGRAKYKKSLVGKVVDAVRGWLS